MTTLTDRLIAPGASRGEAALSYLSAAAGALFAAVLAVHADLAVWRVAIVTVVAFDLFGGAVVNATDAAKRRFHGPGRTRGHHLVFVAAHVQPFVLAWAVPGFGFAEAAVIYALALAATVAVTTAPIAVRRPIAFCATVFAITVFTSVLSVPHAVAWFAPVLLIKLLLAHLLPENSPARAVD